MRKSAASMCPARLQAAAFSQLDKGRWTIWEALDRLGTLREYEAALLAEPGSDMPLLEHAFQTAEACRAAFPASDWLHLCGLIHGLGKVLAHARCGAYQHCVALGRGVWPCRHGLAGDRAVCRRPAHVSTPLQDIWGFEAGALLLTVRSSLLLHSHSHRSRSPVCSHGIQPQWAVCGESFPVGCKFSSDIAFSRFFR